jgi:hypothetical protein
VRVYVLPRACLTSRGAHTALRHCVHLLCLLAAAVHSPLSCSDHSCSASCSDAPRSHRRRRRRCAALTRAAWKPTETKRARWAVVMPLVALSCLLQVAAAAAGLAPGHGWLSVALPPPAHSPPGATVRASKSSSCWHQ